MVYRLSYPMVTPKIPFYIPGFLVSSSAEVFSIKMILVISMIQS